MNRTFTCVAVFGMLLAAVGICLKQTIEFRELLNGLTLAIVLSAQGVLAGVLIASSISLLRKRYARQKKPISRRPVPEAVRV